LLLHSFVFSDGRVVVQTIDSAAAVPASAALAVTTVTVATATAVFFTAVLHTAAIAVTSS
jgi:hypothetical protein